MAGVIGWIASVFEPCFGDRGHLLCEGNLAALFRGLVVLAAVWAVLMLLLLRTAQRGGGPGVGVATAVTVLPLFVLAPALWWPAHDGGRGTVAALAGWLWGIGVAMLVRRKLRPEGRTDRPVAWRDPGDRAQIALGLAVAAPLLLPFLGPLLLLLGDALGAPYAVPVPCEVPPC